MIIYFQMLENSCVEVEHAGKNEKRRREWGGLQSGFQFLIAVWTGDSPFFDALFSGIQYSPFFSPADWEREGRETQSIKRRGKHSHLLGCNYQNDMKALPLAPRETQDLRLYQSGRRPGVASQETWVSLFIKEIYGREIAFFHKGKGKGWKADLETGDNTQWGTCKRTEDSLRHDFNIA